MGSFACENNINYELPQVEFSEFGSDQLGVVDEAWTIARAKVAWALENYGGFEAVYDRVAPRLRDELFQQAMPQFFAAPEVGKLYNPSKIPYHGFMFQKEGFPFLSLQLSEPNSLAAIQDYAKVIWPEGNNFFCNKVWEYAVHMCELMQIIHRMAVECLGLKDHHESHMKSLTCSMRFSKYDNDFSAKKSDVVLPAHKDPNFISIISQHKLEGLQVKTFDGQWLAIAPKPYTFTVLLGEAFMAWSNGRFHAPDHHVKMEGFGTRYSMVYSTFPSKSDNIIEVPKELVDKQHPLLFRPFNYYEYLKFRFSDEGEEYEDTLKAYCGIEQPNIVA
ncbi:hypothetical protein KSP39_PZI018284 [Platanthera zijinensis]|uniref:Isopenicillin N synthase-like Fe(2+) 2OG dioxygenase domain-containing protein n=1 Tax=Platanthera zijinensis TaxID=2320716 RepID=A0AAP0B3S3_9ASPA